MSVSRVPRVSLGANSERNGDSVLLLSLEVQEPIVLAFLRRYQEAERPSMALEALKVGVIAIQSAGPSLDTSIVQEKFGEMEGRLKETVEAFQTEIVEKLAAYFEKGDGIVPKSLEELFGKHGLLAQTFQRYFEPQDGRLVRLMESQIGPGSKFGRSLDPKNKEGVVSLIEDKVSRLVEAKLNQVLSEFSLDHDGSAMCRLKEMMSDSFGSLNQSLGIKAARAEEAERGHVKGLDFESDLYERIAEWGRQLGDDTLFVRGTPGVLKQKLGDHLIILGEATGAPGIRIVVEAKDQRYRFKEAMAELEKAKKNREAACGIFVFSKGCEPSEVGDFRRSGDDFYCTVEKDALQTGGPLPFLWAAYEIARAQAVASVRKETDGQLDLRRIQQSIDALAAWVPRLGEIMTKANTIQNSGKAIEGTAKDMKKEMEGRIKEILDSLRPNRSDENDEEAW
jgi:hypothetical protein